MGRASRRRAEQRSSHRHERVFPLRPRPRQPPVREVPWQAQPGLARLGDLHEQKMGLEGEIERQVKELIAQGASWAAIGRALGITRQGARQRYS